MKWTRQILTARCEETPAAKGNEGSHRLSAWWNRLSKLSQRSPKKLRLCETLPLGERRFVSVIQFENSRFLVGGTSDSLVLLARLDPSGAEPVPPSHMPESPAAEGVLA